MVLIITILQPHQPFFLVIFFHGWPLCFWVPFKHLTNTKTLTKLMEKRCQLGLPLVVLAFTKIRSSLAIFYAPGCVHCAASPVFHTLDVHHALANFPLQASCVCAAPSVCAALLGVCAVLLETSSHALKLSKFHSVTFAMSLPSLQ